MIFKKKIKNIISWVILRFFRKILLTIIVNNYIIFMEIKISIKKSGLCPLKWNTPAEPTHTAPI